MLIAHPGPPKYQPPRLNGPELHVHAHCLPPGVTAGERAILLVFLKRYVVWCAKARRLDQLRGALDLLSEIAVAVARKRRCSGYKWTQLVERAAETWFRLVRQKHL